MPKNKPSALVIQARVGDGPHFDNNFQTHMMLGNHVAGAGPHSGLHSLNTAAGQYPGLTEVTRVATDGRVSAIYAADVRLRPGKTEKRSSFFPSTMTYEQIVATVSEAWRDSKIYTPDVATYRQIRDKYGLAWVGLAVISGQKIWVGSTRSGASTNKMETAFPAVNHQFF